MMRQPCFFPTKSLWHFLRKEIFFKLGKRPDFTAANTSSILSSCLQEAEETQGCRCSKNIKGTSGQMESGCSEDKRKLTCK